MGLVRLIYYSDACESLTAKETVEMLKDAPQRNDDQHLTGVICFSVEHFLQVIEGDPKRVNALYAKLLRDPRHANPTLLDYRAVEQRAFPTWSMGFASISYERGEVVRRYSGNCEFNPARLSAEAALGLLKDMAAFLTERERQRRVA